MKKYLVTGFTPFLDHKVNPTQQIVESIEEENIETFVFNVSYDDVRKSLEQFQLKEYERIILLGLSSNRDHISVEEFAYNEIDVDKPDNEGRVIINQRIDEREEKSIGTSLDHQELCDHFKGSLSQDPGRYLCNYLYYLVLKENRNTVFIHVPKEVKISDFANKIKQLLS
ncbi:MAG: hypothetical protein GY909_02385 [Oligoflexia bacterium]|nr:hypothetical protein [Oligoflexia bacterium]